MRKLALLLAVSFAATPQAARAQARGGHAGGAHPGANPGANAMMRQQQMMQQQQQKMMQQQMRQQQQAAQQQQKMMMQQQQHLKSQQQHVVPNHGNAANGLPANGPSSARHNAKPSAKHHTTKTHKPANLHTTHRPHGLLVWPHSSTASYRHLMQLKRDLDGIAMKSTATASQKLALRNDLLRVVENSPRPSSSHVQQLSDHIAAALADRGTSAVDTSRMAVQLRAMMNSPRLLPGEADQTLMEHRGILATAGVPPDHIDTIAGDLTYLSNEVASKFP